MTKRYVHLFQALLDFLSEEDNETREEVRSNLREAGYDPDELVIRMQERMKKSMNTIKDKELGK